METPKHAGISPGALRFSFRTATASGVIEFEQVHTCDLCGGTEFHEVLHVPDLLERSADGLRSLVRYGRCGREPRVL